MAATKSQGKSFTVFIAGFTVAAAGLATIGSGGGKIALVAGLILTGIAFATFVREKPLEGEPALGPQPAALKLMGIAVVLLGWAVVLLGLHFMSAVSARMILAIVGIAVSLVGMIGILPAASSKNAIWKG